MYLSLLFLSLAVFSAQAGPVLKNCTLGESLVALRVCTPLVDQLKATIERHESIPPTVEQFKNISALCQSTTHCLGDLKCKEAEETREILESACEGFELLGGDIKTCWPKFYTAVQTDKYECTKKYGFVDKDLSKQKTALTTGKSCVLQVVEKECPTTSINFFNNSTNYDKLVKVITTKPNSDECLGTHFNLQAMQCMHSLNEFRSHTVDFSMEVKKLRAGGGVNATVVSVAAQKCRAAKECVSRHCDSNHAENLATMEKQCKKIEDIDEKSAVINCFAKINRERPEKKCIEKEANGKLDCSKIYSEKECVKNMMVLHCGPAVAVDFDKGLPYLEQECHQSNG